MQLLKPKQAIAVAVAFAAAGIGMFADGSVSAKSFEPSDIGTQSYVIGEHLFTRETNPEAGYEGYINTRMIMLAAKTIQGNTLEDMDIYYKKADGSWVDGLTNEAIANMPDSFNIEFKNLDPYVPQVEFTANPIDGGAPSELYGYTTMPYNIRVSNVEIFNLDSGIGQPKADGFEYLALASDVKEWVQAYNTNTGESFDCQVKVGGVNYCEIPIVGSGGVGGAMTGILAPLPVGKTYHLLMRAYKNVDERVVYSEPSTLELTTPTFHKAQISVFPGENTTSFIPDGESIGIGTDGRYGYVFDGWYVGRDCTATERASFGIEEGSLCLCPTSTPYNMASPVTGDVKVAAKWTAKVYSIKVMPTDAVGAIMGTAKVYADGVEITDKYVAQIVEDGTPLFDSENPSIALSELSSITSLKLVITYDNTAGGGTSEETFTTTASVTQVPYSN